MARYLHWISLLAPILFVWVLLSPTAAGDVFVEEPADASIIIGQPASFKCRVRPELVQQTSPPDNNVVWYQIKSGSGVGAEAITHADEGRFFVVGLHANGVFDLYVNYTKSSDKDTSYLCVFNKTASRHAYLNLLPENWMPTCLSFPNTASVHVMVGEEIEIICASSGDARTELMWQRNGAVIEGMRTTSGDAVSLTYKEEVSNDESLMFTCSASLVGKQGSEICTIGPIQVLGKPDSIGSYIPYIIVGLLSVVVSMLFLTLLVVVFRHRQCRMCHREPPEPQTVLDMSQLQAGGPPPFFPIHGDDDDDDASDDGIGRSPPPDLIPTTVPATTTVSGNSKKPKSNTPKRAQTAKPQRSRQQEQQPRNRPGPGVARSQTTRARPSPQPQPAHPPLRRTSSNTTLQENIDEREKDKTVTGKTKLTMTNFVRSSNNKAATSQKQPKGPRQSRPSQSKARESGGRRRAKQPDNGGQSQKQLNIGTKPSTSNDAGLSTNDISLDIDLTSPDDPNARNLNDLSDNTIVRDSASPSLPGRQSLYRHNPGLTPRPVSQELNNPEEVGHLQTKPSNTGASGSNSASASASRAGPAPRSDKIIYAELDFKKSVGLNILPDV